MAKDVWLPNGLGLPDGSRVRSLLYAGEDWQVLSTRGSGRILVARPELAQKWCDTGLVDGPMLGAIAFGTASFRTLASQERYALAPVQCGVSPETKVDTIAFALALRESRRLSKDASFHDAIYVEQCSRLLPTWTLTPRVDDDVVLGTWVTGGVVVSTRTFRRLCCLMGWMSPADLAEVVKAAGLPLESEAVALAGGSGGSTKHSRGGAQADGAAGQPGGTEAADAGTPPRVFALPGRPQLESFLREHVIDIIVNAERYQALGIGFPSAILLHGPPGCGKTFAVERLVDFLDWPSYPISSSSVGSPYIHQTSRKISEVFDQAVAAAPSVVIIDEMESFLSDRQSAGVSGLYHVEEVAEFLRRLPEASAKKVLVVAMTNLLAMIDPAILRRGRFDHVVEVGMPSSIEVVSLLNSLLSKLPKSEDLDLGPVLDALAGKPLSDSAFVVREAARLAARAGKSRIDQESLTAALMSLADSRDTKARQIGFRPES
jgi:hypothetical protein